MCNVAKSVANNLPTCTNRQLKGFKLALGATLVLTTVTNVEYSERVNTLHAL